MQRTPTLPHKGAKLTMKVRCVCVRGYALMCEGG